MNKGKVHTAHKRSPKKVLVLCLLSLYIQEKKNLHLLCLIFFLWLQAPKAGKQKSSLVIKQNIYPIARSFRNLNGTWASMAAVIVQQVQWVGDVGSAKSCNLLPSFPQQLCTMEYCSAFKKKKEILTHAIRQIILRTLCQVK